MPPAKRISKAMKQLASIVKEAIEIVDEKLDVKIESLEYAGATIKVVARSDDLRIDWGETEPKIEE